MTVSANPTVEELLHEWDKYYPTQLPKREGTYQTFNAASGQWEYHDSGSAGGFFDWVEANPELFGALAFASVVGGGLAAPVGAGGTAGEAGVAAGEAGVEAGTAGAGVGAVDTGLSGAGTLSEFGALSPAGASTFTTGGAGGFLGTGLTASQIKTGLSLLSTGISAAGGGYGGGSRDGGTQAGGGSTTTGTSNVLDPATQQLLTTILGDQFPARYHGWLDVLNQFVQRANASPEALHDLASPQLRQMGQAILQANQTASRTLGPYGGAQEGRVRGHAAAPGPALEAYMSPWFAGEQASSGLVDATRLPVPQGRSAESTTSYGVDPNQVAALTKGLFNLVQGVKDQWPGSASTGLYQNDPTYAAWGP